VERCFKRGAGESQTYWWTGLRELGRRKLFKIFGTKELDIILVKKK
jgi:hypothetical protein